MNVSTMKLAKLPCHVAIIMDGNGRWAKAQNKSRSFGHIEGVRRVEEIVDAANELGIKVLTLFTFSTENWTRPKSEVAILLKTMCDVLERKVTKLKNDNIKFQLIGKKEGVPDQVLATISRTAEATKNNTGMILNMAFNYGGRVEILNAVKNIAFKIKEGILSSDDITEKIFAHELYTRGLPDPDLLIRTSGEQRISNFLLWQLSYAELYFTDKCWPEFTKAEFIKALKDYESRERRYGDIEAKNN